MDTIQVTPELFQQYIGMNKNAVILHMALTAHAQEGKLERNILKFSKLVNRARDRLRDAEHELKRKELLCIHWVGNQQWWYVYDRPTRPQAVPTPLALVATTDNQSEEKENPKSWWQKLKETFGNEPLDYELTKS